MSTLNSSIFIQCGLYRFWIFYEKYSFGIKKIIRRIWSFYCSSYIYGYIYTYIYIYIYIYQKGAGPRVEPWGTPELTFAYVECWPFRTTVCFLPFRKLVQVSSKINLYSIMLQFICKTIIPDFMKGFGYIKTNYSDFKPIFKRLIYSNRY